MNPPKSRVVLISRVASGFSDLFVFKVNGKTVKRFYDYRLFDDQATNLLIREIKQGKIELETTE